MNKDNRVIGERCSVLILNNDKMADWAQQWIGDVGCHYPNSYIGFIEVEARRIHPSFILVRFYSHVQFFSPGYHDADNDITKNTITFEVALTMLNHTYNDTSPYTVGFTIWKRDQDSVEIMWSAQQSVQAEDTSLPELVR